LHASQKTQRRIEAAMADDNDDDILMSPSTSNTYPWSQWQLTPVPGSSGDFVLSNAYSPFVPAVLDNFWWDPAPIVNEDVNTNPGGADARTFVLVPVS
jgi:hypothetical protein